MGITAPLGGPSSPRCRARRPRLSGSTGLPPSRAGQSRALRRNSRPAVRPAGGTGSDPPPPGRRSAGRRGSRSAAGGHRESWKTRRSAGCGFERQVGAARLQDRQQEHDQQLRASAPGERRRGTSGPRPRPEAGGQAVGPAGQLAVGQLLRLEARRPAAREPAGLVLERRGGGRPGGGPVRVVPFGDAWWRFRRGEQGELRRAAAPAPARAGESAAVRSRAISRSIVAASNRSVAYSTVAEEPAVRALRGQREIELRQPCPRIAHRPQAQILDLQASRRERSGGRASPGTGARGRGSAPEPAPRPAFRTARPGADRRRGRSRAPGRAARGRSGSPRRSPRRTSGVDEEPDQPLDLHPVAPGHGGAHREIVLAAGARQQGLEGGQQHHEERRSLAPAESLQPPGEPGRQAAPAGVAPR